jgi:hypothetical protein
MYASETWVLKENKIRMLSIWERKMLRKISGVKKEGNEWKIQNNQELRNMYRQPDILVTAQNKGLEWLGHVVRMEKNQSV